MLRIEIADVRLNTAPVPFECDLPFVSFGRSLSCTYVLDHPDVSRRHFFIRFEQDGYVAFDEGSKFGTQCDGHVLESAPLTKAHRLEIPGFVITVAVDGRMPSMEHTSIVARKLMGEMLENSDTATDCPFLINTADMTRFVFASYQSTFVMGCHEGADFIVAESQARELASFVRDLHGVRLLAICGIKTLINDQEIGDIALLCHRDVLSLAGKTFIFLETENDDFVREVIGQTLPANSVEPHDDETGEVSDAPKSQLEPVISLWDKLFLVGFIFVVAGTGLVLLKGL